MHRTSEMSDYERSVWQRLVAETTEDHDTPPGRLRSGLVRARVAASAQIGKAKDAVMSLPNAEAVGDAINSAVTNALDGLHSMTVNFGLHSVSHDTVIKHFTAKGHPVESLDDIRSLDIRACDSVSASGKQKYLVAGSEGAASSLVVTGLTVSSTVSGGTTAAAAAAAIAADSVTVLTGMGRIIAHVAAHYGYDVNEPDEEVFAAGVLSYSTATGASQKATTLAALSRLTQDMMRRTTMATLSQNQIVRVIETVFKALGVKMTRKKLAQAVPVAGALINGGMNAQLAAHTYSRALTAYRLRFLTEKYGLDPAEWRPDVDATDEDSGMPLIDEILDAELADEDHARRELL
ncbi:hypothetical protein GCM10023353_39080 [Tomitella cavernea]|uniref:EcsC family protein n=1 Tax=Tomitella cavernea TaxID=1387982 RepID=A0ABP9D4C4_9ACTN